MEVAFMVGIPLQFEMGSHYLGAAHWQICGEGGDDKVVTKPKPFGCKLASYHDY